MLHHCYKIEENDGGCDGRGSVVIGEVLVEVPGSGGGV